MDLNTEIFLGLRALSLVLSLIGFFMGIWFIGRFSGRIKTAIIFLILAIFTLVVVNTITILSFFIAFKTDVCKTCLNAISTFFLVFAMIKIGQAVRVIDGYAKRKK